MAYSKEYWLNKQGALQNRYQKKVEDVLAVITKYLNSFYEDKNDMTKTIEEINVIIQEQDAQAKIKEKEMQGQKEVPAEASNKELLDKSNPLPASELKKINKQKNGK